MGECNAFWPEASCAVLQPHAAGASDDDDDDDERGGLSRGMRQNIAEAAVAITVGVLCGLCCCTLAAWLVIQRLYGDQLRELLEQRTMRKGAARLREPSETPAADSSAGAARAAREVEMVSSTVQDATEPPPPGGGGAHPSGLGAANDMEIDGDL